MSNKKNPCVFLDLSFDGSPAERIVIELFADVVPNTAENFRALCTGGMGKGKPLHYRGTLFNRIYNGVFAQGGDFSNQNGDGGLFADKNFKWRHLECGMLTVHPCLNGSKFFMILGRLPGIDWGHTVFGKVIEGMETVKKIDKMGTPKGKPSGQVTITNCGEILEEDKNKYVMESDKGKKKRTRKRAKPSNYVSEFYSSKRKHSSSKSSDSDSEFYSSLRVKIRDRREIPQDKKNNVMESDKGKEENNGKKARSSDESSDERVRKKQRVSTVCDKRKYWSSSKSEIYIKLMVMFAEKCKIPEDKKNNLMESDKGKKEKTTSSDENSDETVYWLSEIPNYVLEFYSSRRKYWSSISSNSDSGVSPRLVRNTYCGEIPEDKKNNVMESDKGKKEKSGKGATSTNSDSEFYHLRRRMKSEFISFKSSNSYSSE